MRDIQRHNTDRRLSHAVAFGWLVFVAGQVDDEHTDVPGQTRSILDKIDRLLSLGGTDRTRILSATIWLADISAYDAVNAVWDVWIPDGSAPARACIEARLARPNLLVEISVVAARIAD